MPKARLRNFHILIGYAFDSSNKGIVSFGSTDTSFGLDIFNSKHLGLLRSICMTFGLSKRSSMSTIGLDCGEQPTDEPPTDVLTLLSL